MLRVFRINEKGIVEITRYCESVNFNGSLNDVARKLEVTTLFNMYDSRFGKAQLGCGDKIKATWNDVEIFQGIIVDRAFSGERTLGFTALDYAFYLKQSKVTFNFNNTTAEQATGKILQELGVNAGYLEKTNIKLSRLINQKSGYDAIMELYSQVSKQNKNQYFLELRQGKVYVTYLGKHTVSKEIRLSDSKNTNNLGNLISLEYRDSISGMYNRIRVYDSNNKYKTTIENKDNIKRFGILQDNYVIEDGKDYRTVAKGMLTDIEKQVTVEILGDIGFQSGRAVNVRVPVIDVIANRHMYIIEDVHEINIATSDISTSLTLSFENKMDFKEDDN